MDYVVSSIALTGTFLDCRKKAGAPGVDHVISVNEIPPWGMEPETSLLRHIQYTVRVCAM